jgi:hypothetical protein
MLPPCLHRLVRMRLPLVVGVLLITAMAGCLGGGSEVEPEDEDGADPRFTEDTGSLTGQVMNRDLLPLGGATITLSQANEERFSATSRGDGRYAVNFVEPGTYRVQVVAPWHYSQVANVEIKAGDETPKNFILDEVTEDDLRFPYQDGPHDWSGFIGCSAGGVPICQFDPNDDRRKSVDVERGVKTITVGVNWSPNGLAGATDLVLEIRHEPKILATVTGKAPAFEITLDDSLIEDETLRFENFEDGGWLVEFRVYTPVGEPVVAFQQPFTVWWTFHYWQPAPPGYSTLPEV